MKQKKLLSLIGIFVLVIGLGAGITLVQESQLFRQKAATKKCGDLGTTNQCGPLGGCNSDNKRCRFVNSSYICEKDCLCISDCYERCKCNGHSNEACKIACPDIPSSECAKQGYTCRDTCLIDETKLSYACSPPAFECCRKTGGCSSESETICKTKNVSASCGTNKTCKSSGTGSDGRPICKCQTTGGGGGGGPKTPKPTKKPGGGGGGGGGGGECNVDYEGNPSVFTGFTKSGGLTLFVDPGPYQFNIALKKNVDSCSQTDYDVLLDTKDAVDNKLPTGLQVAQGDKVCVYAVGYEGTPGGGWIEPTGGLCKGPKGTPKDISALLAKAPEAVSVQCWGDVEIEDCDFNDFVFVFTVGEGIVTGNGLKLRFQGITKKANDQLINASLIQSGSIAWNAQAVNVINDDNGVYTLNVNSSVVAGTYDLLLKGHSHLQKRFSNLVYNGDNQIVDLSTTEANQCRAGDVTDDNVITIDDVAAVSKYYTDFAVAVNSSDAKMVAADINKDSKITIQDLALIAINWSDFKVEGDK